MTLEEAKQELVKRYRYLYENAYFILAPYVQEESKEEFELAVKRNKERNGRQLFQQPVIYLNINILDDINRLLEEFLLSDKPMEESTLYQFVEEKRTDKKHLDKVKKGIELIEKANEGINYEQLKTKIDIWEVFEKVTSYVEAQSGDLRTKGMKLCTIDQYYRLLRYNNDGRVYTSGRNLNLHDCSSLRIPLKEHKPCRDEKDIGVEKNPFISTIAYAPFHVKNLSIFSEKEKQKIYLLYHDELPCDLRIYCKREEDYVSNEIESKMRRPENTAPCDADFIIKEEEIFVNPSDRLYRYYQLCPHCGYIVNIPNEILSEGIKCRIEDRCKQDDKLFRKMYLYSELFSLDKSSTNGQKKILTNKKS